MPDLIVKSLDGGTTTLPSSEIAALRRDLRGALCLPGEPGYDVARTLWNAMIDRHPAAVIRPADAGDVARAVRVAGENEALLAVRGGGHNIAGTAVCEGGLLLDLSVLRAVRVDPAARTARVDPGVTLAELDRETQAFGLATPLGINSTTGVAGLTLGGGFGWLSRKFGLTVDNLLSVDVVTADGELVRASEQDDAELFWAVRGGGGNFGVATSFEYRLHAVGPEVLSGLVIHPAANAAELLSGYRRAAANAPDDMTCWVVLRKAPPLPFLPTDVHGTDVMVLAMCHAGDPARAGDVAAPFRTLGKPIADVVAPQPFTAWESAFDPLLTPGARNYWKSHDLRELSDPAIAILVEAARTVPSPECELFIGQLGGAVNRVPVDATAYPHRDVQFVVNVHARWREPSQDQACIAWARQLFDALAPHATGGVYVNFMPEDEMQRVASGAYGPNHARLAKLKGRYDPKNLFRLNHNIRPAG
jgi:FAD/FMN-containing dehydrogenase